MNRKSGEIESDQRHLDVLRRGKDEAAEHIAKSQEAIDQSLALLRIVDTIEAEQKSRRKPAGRRDGRGAPE
jgi:hypothetical protein